MKHLLVVTLLICLLTGIAPACASSSQSALTQNGIYDEWYTVSATMFDDIKFDPKDPNIAYAVANKELYKSYDGGDDLVVSIYDKIASINYAEVVETSFYIATDKLKLEHER